MQIVKNKKVWLFLILGIAAVTAACFLASAQQEKKTYVNGRIVENQQNGEKVIEICWEQK